MVLTDFHGVRSPAGGNPYGPESMRRTLLTVYDPKAHTTILSALRRQLGADGWKTLKDTVSGT